MCVREWIWKDTEERERVLVKLGAPLPNYCCISILSALSINRLHYRTERKTLQEILQLCFCDCSNDAREENIHLR